MQSFDELKLSAPVMKAITEMGYTQPSPIQKEALPLLLGAPTDFIGLAATGTGKTAGFGIPALERIDPNRKGVQVLILCPTRELALQVSNQINLMGKYLGVNALPIYGGSGYSEQIQGLRRGDAIVVGTPGRVIDHMNRGTLSLHEMQVLILDEADEMISMGFKEELDQILSQVPKENSNIWLFSATMSREVRRVADTYLSAPKQVQINRTEVLSSTVEQIFYTTQEQNKPEVVCKLIDVAQNFYGIIFCQTKLAVHDLSQYLAERGYKVDSLHGDKDQRGRERTMTAFREKKVNMLVCTDVASRGLDVKDITHVINYSLPRELDSYVHRIGRTARSGKAGLALSLVTKAQRGLVGRIETATKSRMKEGVIPSRKEIGAIKVGALLPSFQAQQFADRAVSALSTEWKEALASMTVEEVAGRFLCLSFPEVFVEKEMPAKLPVTSERLPSRESGMRDRRSFGRAEPRNEQSRFNRDRPMSNRDRPASNRDRPVSNRDRAYGNAAPVARVFRDRSGVAVPPRVPFVPKSSVATADGAPRKKKYNQRKPFKAFD